jgi:hypothetical protein
MQSETEIIPNPARNIVDDNDLEDFEVVVRPLYFTILCIVTFGLYKYWWSYKSWKYIKEREMSSILPVFNAFLLLFTAISLFKKILYYAKSRNYSNSYSPIFLFILLVLLFILGKLAGIYSVIAIFNFVPFLAPVKAFNFYFTGETNPKQYKLQPIDIFFFVSGLLAWVLMFYLISIGVINDRILGSNV